jgi:hypothetical protein
MGAFTGSIQDSGQTNFPFLAVVSEAGRSIAQIPCATRQEAEVRIRETIRALERMHPPPPF